MPDNDGVPRLFMDLTPLRVSVPYRRMWLGTSLSGIGTALTTVAVGLQVYDETGSTASVGLVGLFAFVPLAVLGLYGGVIVDAYDRRSVIVLTSAGLFVVAVGFAVQAWLELGDVRILYGLVAIQSGLFAVNSPARTAIVPRLVGRRLLAAANALTSVSFGVSLTLGPLLAGFLVGGVGYGWTYGIEAVLLVLALLTLVTLPPLPPDEVASRRLSSVVEGLRFLRTRPNIRATFILDLTATVLAMPRVLFPAIGVALIGGGATTVGVLTAGIAIGSVLAGLLSGPLGGVRRQGLAIVVAVMGWGVAVAGFGLVVANAPGSAGQPLGDVATWALWPAAGCMVLAGAADTVSSIFRSTILQAATPDALRGRLQGVFIIVVAGGPRLGDLLLGAVGDLGGEAFAAIAGGLVCTVVALAFGLSHPRFRSYDAENPVP